MQRTDVSAAVPLNLPPTARVAAGPAPITNAGSRIRFVSAPTLPIGWSITGSGGTVFAERCQSSDRRYESLCQPRRRPSDNPQPLSFEIADTASPEEVLRRAADLSWLPSIQGNRATWSIASNEPLAVLAYEWPDLKFLPQLAERMRTAERRDGALLLFFNYHAQHDPEMVYRILWSLQLHS